MENAKFLRQIRQQIKNGSDKELMDTWEVTKDDTSLGVIAANAILETELEARGLIKLNEDTFEYEITGEAR